MKQSCETASRCNKIDHFRELLEETGYQLSDRHYMPNLIPFVRREEETRIKQEISRKHVVVFDSTTHLGEALAIVLRFVSDSEADL